MKEIKWSAWPAKRQPVRGFFAAFICMGSILIASEVFWMYGIAAAVLLLSTLGEILLPTWYRMNESGVKIIGLHTGSEKSWSQFSGWKKTESGFRLKSSIRRRFFRQELMLYCFEERDKVEFFLKQQLTGENDGSTSD